MTRGTGTAATLLLSALVVGILAFSPVGLWAGASIPPTPASAHVQTAVVSPSGGDWPTYLHDNDRSGVSPNGSGLPAALAPNLKVQWNFTTHGVIVAAPIVVNDTVFVGSWDGNEYALNASSGAVRWATYLGQSATAGCGSNVRGVSSTATFDSGVLYVGGGHSQWFALNASTGVILWNVSTGNPLAEYNWGSPLIVGSYAYVGLASACDHPLIRGELMQVNLTSHMVDHIFYTVGPSAPGGSIWGSPTYDPLTNDVLAATGNGWAKYPYPYTQSLLAFNAMNVSNLAGHYQIPRNATGPDSDFGSTPTLVQDSRGNPRVVVANKDGLLYAFNRTNITAGPVWADNISVGGPCPECAQGSISPAAFDGKFIYAGGGKTTINGKWYRGGERQIDPSNGTVLWARGFPAPVVPATSAANGVLVIEAGMKLYVLNASTGQTLRAFAAHTLLYASAAISERCIFFGSTDFHVYALGVPGVACGPIAPVGHLPHLAHGPGHPPESKHPARPMPQAIRATLVRSRPGSSRGPA